ncbi:Vesicle coat complex COPI, gamma subunit [Trachipleistophora hominis]|uniref:Vesicle coat complex COPI, gamma subunit n=1 Tax=Trachipleistophora hominis TaxID=72359 RepID=L7JZ43_TRAHO|nr:Vesicle coat complex COPI, gamma subunit [Trachipleistophora hominis]
MSSKLLTEIKSAFQQGLTPRNIIKSLVSLLKHIQNNALSAQHTEQIAFFLLRSFSLNNNFVNQLVYVCLNLLLPFDNSFVAINIIDKKEELGLRLLIKIVPEEMVGDFMKYVMECKDADLGMLCLLRLHRDMVLREMAKELGDERRPTSDQVRKASNSLVAYFGKLRAEFMRYHKVDTSRTVQHYHAILFDSIEKPFSSFYREGQDQRYSVIGRGMAGAQQARTTNNLRDHLNVKISGEICFTEALRKVSYMKDPVPFLSQAITNAGILLNSNDAVVRMSTLRSLDALSQNYARKVAVLNPSLIKINDDHSLRILLRTGDSNTIERIANTDLTQYDDEKALLIVKAFGTIAQKNGKEEEMARFLKPLMFKRSSLEMKKEIVRLYGELLGECMIDDECYINYEEQEEGTAVAGTTSPKNTKENDKTGGEERTIKSALNKNYVMDVLVDYLEDSQYSTITNDILGLIKDKKYLVAVYNRLILENEIVRNNAMACVNRLTGKSLFEENEDELLKYFFTNRKDVDVRKYVSNKKKESIFIKETRPVVLLHKEMKVVLVKRVFRCFVYVLLKMENTTKDLDIADGKMLMEAEEGKERYWNEKEFCKSAHYDEEYMKGDFQFMDCCAGQDDKRTDGVGKTTTVLFGIKAGFSTTVVMKRALVLNTEFSAVCFYDLTDPATEESENETRELRPFNVNYLDTIKPCSHGKTPLHSKKTSFALEGKSLGDAKEEVLDIFNLQVVDQVYADDVMQLVLEGVTIDGVCVRIDVRLESMSNDVGVFLKVFADSVEVIERIISVLQ